MSDVFVGIDPGTRNLGIARYDAATTEWDAYLHDTLNWGGRTHRVGNYQLSSVVERVVRHYRDLFASARVVVVERQPTTMLDKKKSGKGYVKSSGAKTIAVVESLLIQTIRLLCPGVRVCSVDPKSVRAFFGTSGEQYAGRKNKSILAFKKMVSAQDYAKYESAYRLPAYDKTGKLKKTKELKADPAEALLFAVYAAQNEDKLKDDEDCESWISKEPTALLCKGGAVEKLTEKKKRKRAEPKTTTTTKKKTKKS